MIARKLLSPESLAGSASLRFSDHTRLTEVITEPYRRPEHLPGPGILACLSGAGRYTINGQPHQADQDRYLLIDKDSRLSIRFTHAGAQPLLLFFQSDPVARPLGGEAAELCWLEREYP